MSLLGLRLFRAAKGHRKTPQTQLSPVSLVDEGAQLLRTLPAEAIVVYLTGVLPFIIGFLYFSFAMFYGAYAWRYCGPAALLMAFCYCWMKTWQARFHSIVWAWIGGGDPPEFTLGFGIRLFARQLLLQPLALFILPISMLLVFTMPTVVLFFVSASIFSGLETYEFRRMMTDSFRIARRDIFIYLPMFLLLSLLSFVLVINIGLMVGIGPTLLKTVLGINSPFSRAGWLMFASPAYWGIVLALSYLAVDPLIRCTLTLYCFYTESRTSGDDMRAELRGIRLRRNGFAATAILIFAAFLGTSVLAPAGAEVSERSIEDSIGRTLHKPDYSWRMKRVTEEEEEEIGEAGVVENFYRSVNQIICDIWRYVKETVVGIISAVRDFFRNAFRRQPPRPTPNSGPSKIPEILKPILYTLAIIGGIAVAIVLIITLILFIRKLIHHIRNRGSVDDEPKEMIQPDIDLEDEEVTADQLPEDDWLAMGGDLVEKGDLRLALRAFYLALLAYLGRRHLIAIAKFKSNGDYVRELQRRAHELPNALDAFCNNVRVFEFAWYGMHQVEQDALNTFKANIEAIRDEAEA